MKTLLISAFTIIALIVNSNVNYTEKKIQIKPKTHFFRIPDNYEIGIRKRGCEGYGITCLYEIDWDNLFKQNNPQYVQATLMDSKNLSFTFFVRSYELENEFLVEDVSKNLFQKHAQRFGCSFLELLPGTYRTTKLSDGRVNVILKVTSR